MYQFNHDATFKIPDIEPLPFRTGALLFAAVAGTGIAIGATIGTYVFFGVVTLAGLVALAETNKYIRYMIVKGNKTIDVLIFVSTVIATASLGVTVAASLTVAGLGYTLLYAPWLRKRSESNK